jgi:hypothetical protein
MNMHKVNSHIIWHQDREVGRKPEERENAEFMQREAELF